MIICLLQTLGQEYQSIVKKKPLSVLQALLLSGFDNRYKLMDICIKAIQINTEEVGYCFVLPPNTSDCVSSHIRH